MSERNVARYFQFGQILLAKMGNGSMIGMHISSNESERDYFVSRPLNLARTENASGVAVKQQPQ